MNLTSLELPTSEEIQKEFDKRELENDLLKFLIWQFKKIKKEEFLENWHHRMIADALMKVYRGELRNLIINIPPRYTKTELVIKSFVAWCYAKNPRCEFLHLSYSDDLALDNSSAIKDTINSEEFQYYWPIGLKKDSTSKKKWKTEAGGIMGATATGGQVTGFGAGATNEVIDGEYQFSGALLIDDPIKPEDAKSDLQRSKINERFNNTLKSRLNSPDSTPIIVIMQRVHENDMSGFLLDGGSEFDFVHINLPAINEEGPNEFDPREKGEALWPLKHDEESLARMAKKSPTVHAGQYQQRPAPMEGNIIKQADLRFYYQLPKDIHYRVHSCDLAFKGKKESDYVVASYWGRRHTNQDIYLIDLIRDKMTFSETLKALRIFFNKHDDYNAILIEDKANGPAIIDSLYSEFNRIIEVDPQGSKEERFEAAAPLVEAGNVWLPHPSIAPWVKQFITELITFPNAVNDDQCDVFSQATLYLDNKGKISLTDIDRDQASRSKTYREEFASMRRKKKKTGIRAKEY